MTRTTEAGPVLIRPMRPDDTEAALRLLASIAAEGIWLGTEADFDRDRRRESWLASLTDPHVRALVAVDGEEGPGGAAAGRLVGHGSVHLARYGVAELGMCLAADMRGRGLGRRLLDDLIEVARGLGAHKVELQVWPHNEPAIRLYLSRGFVVEGRLRGHYRRQSGELWDAIVMGLPLDPEVAAGELGSGLPDAPALPSTMRISP